MTIQRWQGHTLRSVKRWYLPPCVEVFVPFQEKTSVGPRRVYGLTWSHAIRRAQRTTTN